MEVLTVCTGNICRSPVAERLLRTGLASLSAAKEVRVSSAGTRAVVGHPIQAEMAGLLAADGVDARGFTAQQVTAESIDRADLILVAAREHRRRLIQLRPSALGKSFMLNEFARLTATISDADAPSGVADRLRWLTRLAPMERGRQGVPPVDDDDIVDPYLRGPDAYQAAYTQIGRAVSSVLDRLR